MEMEMNFEQSGLELDIDDIEGLTTTTESKEEVFGEFIDEDDVLDNNPTDIYNVEFRCENCGKVKNYHIPRGITAKSYLYNTECVFCNCYLIQKRKRVKKSKGDEGKTEIESLLDD